MFEARAQYRSSLISRFDEISGVVSFLRDNYVLAAGTYHLYRASSLVETGLLRTIGDMATLA
jgi:hypothetical protein